MLAPIVWPSQVVLLPEQLRHLSFAVKILDDRGACPTPVRKAIYGAQRAIRAEHKASMRQTKITDWWCGDN